LIEFNGEELCFLLSKKFLCRMAIRAIRLAEHG